MDVSPALFACFQKLIYEQAGIWLAPHKTALLRSRLSQRLRELGCSGMAEYYAIVSREGSDVERQRMLDCVTTHETHFFREPQHFKYLEQEVFPRWRQEAQEGRRPRRVRVWSAGCSTGQEPYSLAMLLLENFRPSQSWLLEVMATDISTRALDSARAALYPAAQADEIPGDYLRRYMLRGTDEREGWIRPAPEVRALVSFGQLNLMDEKRPSAERFDLVFCRNVMIYFDLDSKRKSTALLSSALSPQGLLMAGHSENLHGLMPGLKLVAPTIYALKDLSQ
jgi:chemotaxis protein methyltransferase CheR